MARKPIALLATALVLALAGFAPTASSAAYFHFEKNEVIGVVNGEGASNHVFDLAGGTLSCKVIELEGSESVLYETAESLQFKVSYAGCTMFNAPATVSTGACGLFRFSADGWLLLGAESVQCDLNPMTVDVSSLLFQKCRIKLKSQLMPALTFGNTGTGSSRKVTVNIGPAGLSYEAEGSLCKETGKKNNGSYTSGSIGLEAEQAGGEGPMIGMWWE